MAGPRRRSLVGRTVVLLSAFFSIIAPLNSSAGVFLQPVVGLKVPTGDIADILAPGVEVGGRLGIELDDRLDLVGHLDVGIHSANQDLNFFFDSGMTLNLLAGIQLSLADQDGAGAIPRLALYAGRSATVWNYTSNGEFLFLTDTDGVGAWSLAGEGELDIPIGDSLYFSGLGRLTFHAWDDETTEGYGFDGDGMEVSATMGLRFSL